MGSDLARISFDPTRGYRSVVAQQGRVTLEADVNEETTIAGEALRLETIDIVGPAGTPDPLGYQVYYDAKLGLAVRPGTMYLGGWRLTLDDVVPFDKQPDWLHRAGPGTGINQKTQQYVATLLAIEQNISATEDQALREVALGGPDTSARTRLMQHFVLIPTTDSLCDAAEKGVQATLAGEGLSFDPATAALTFNADLQVSFYPPPQPQNPCCSSAQGGYLGADNQLVQVTVSEFSGTSGTLLWGWNNASFLYRATVVSPTVLQLGQAPIDAAHTPQPGQVIEILQTEAVLGAAQDKNYVAAPQGTVVTMGTGSVYDPNTLQVTVPSGTTLPSDANSLFVRLWQGEVPFTSGQPAHLDDTSGLAVTVRIKALPTGQMESRPFWCFAVRPNTPQKVYPNRFFESPQPPDGPRQWLCELAIVESLADNREWKRVADCRIHFLPLTSQTGCDCCQLTLSPSEDWLSKLNAALAGSSPALNLCFQPGEFDVDSTITFAGKMVKITGAGEGTVISGKGLEVVIEFNNCPNVVLSDLSVVAGTAGYSNNRATAGLQGAVTVNNCNQVDVERVFLACAEADLRAASCLAVYNPAPVAGKTPDQFNLRVRNSQFDVGHYQVGILMVNADRAQIEGNLIITPPTARNFTHADLATNNYLAMRLRKQLLHSMTIVNTAPPTTKKAQRRLRRKLRNLSAATSVPANAPARTPEAQSAPAEPNAAPAPNAATGANVAAGTGSGASSEIVVHDVAQQQMQMTKAVTSALPQINIGQLGRAHINTTFGTFKLQFISSQKLTNAWSDALSKAGLTQSSTAGDIHRAVLKIADAVFKNPKTVSAAFNNWVAAVLPSLYSTSGQGIVVGGTIANDIRILNNTVDGTVQGIHVGLGNGKANPAEYHLKAGEVQIRGNTVNLRLTAEMTGDRHGIFLSGVTSAIVSDNHVQLTRAGEAGQEIFAIKAAGDFGLRVLVERNAMIGFNRGLWLEPNTSAVPKGDLWKASDNASDSLNGTSCFLVQNNVP